VRFTDQQEYTVWRDTATAAGTVTVLGGRVTEFRLA
jgi:hypothetical protein